MANLQPLLNPRVAAVASVLAPISAFFAGLGVGLPVRSSAAIAGFCWGVLISAPAYARAPEPAVHGTDLDRRGRPRVNRLYRTRSLDPIYWLLNRSPAQPLPAVTAAVVVLAYGVVMGAGAYFAPHGLLAVAVLFAALYVVAGAVSIGRGRTRGR